MKLAIVGAGIGGLTLADARPDDGELHPLAASLSLESVLVN